VNPAEAIWMDGKLVFVVARGVVATPGFGADILGGINRESVITIARDLGYRRGAGRDHAGDPGRVRKRAPWPVRSLCPLARVVPAPSAV
jgi:hypothetical protein